MKNLKSHLCICGVWLVYAFTTVACQRWSDESLALQNEIFNISEGDGVIGSLLFTLTIVNGSQDVPFTLIGFDINSDVVSINSDNGQVSVQDPPDFDSLGENTQSVIEFKAIVNSAWLNDSLLITYRVTNINDEAPNFEPLLQNEYLIPEADEDVPAVVVDINAVDADSTNLTFHLSNDNGVTLVQRVGSFEIDRLTGVLSLVEPIDYEDNNAVVKHALEVIVSDNDPVTRLLTSADIDILIVDIQDEPPTLNRPSASVEENISNGSTVVTYIGEDGDATNKNPVEFSIESASVDGLFAVEQSSGILTTIEYIDAESLPEDIELTIKVTEICPEEQTPCSSAIFTRSVSIQDLNDNPPIFSSGNYKAEVSENPTLGKAIGIISPFTAISASDADREEKTLSVSIVDTQEFVASNYVSVDPVDLPVSALEWGDVALKVKDVAYFDYEVNKELTISLQVTDGGGAPAFTTVDITILDANDNAPLFEQESFQVSLMENLTVGSTVFEMKATDVDTESTLSYSFSCSSQTPQQQSPDCPFGILNINQTGIISLQSQSSFDYESVTSYVLDVQVTDGSHITDTTLTVLILDVNDNEPEFDKEEYYATVEENVNFFTVQLQASDGDATSPNKDFTFLLVSSTDGEWNVDADTGLISLEKKLDRESIKTGNITLNVLVADNGDPQLTSDVLVIIDVVDQNDVNPEFSSDSYQFSIFENASQGYVVGNVSASDGDYSVPYSTVLYSMTNSDRFSLNNVSGNIIIEDSTLLDLDSYPSSYELEVSAYNQLDQSLPWSTVKVNVSVLDVNNKMPVFSPSSYTISVPEDLALESVVRELIATDTDENADLDFRLDPIPSQLSLTAPFRMENNELVLKHSLDREQVDQYNLVCIVTDLNAADGVEQVDRATITVTVTDINDNSPILTSPTALSISENRSPNLTGNPITQFQGADADIAANGNFLYSLSEENPIFAVDNIGFLYLKTSVDYENQSSYNFELVLTDQPTDATQTPRRSTYIITVNILNDNDNNPEIESPSSPLEVPENAAVGYVIHQFLASDADGDTDLSFLPLGGTNLDIAIRANGSLYVSAALDRERTSQYDISVHAEDSSNRVGTLRVVVSVLDINDNDPIFPFSMFTFDVLEDAQVGSQVGVVSATDADEGNNGVITYFIDSFTQQLQQGQTVPDRNPFSIGVSDGIILVNISLSNLIGQFNLTVTARDSDSRRTSTLVVINVKDVNNHPPVITYPEFNQQFNISEVIPVGSVIVQVEAEDQDNGLNSQLSYSLESSQPSDLTKFIMQGSQLVVGEDLSNPQVGTQQHTLVIVVRDGGSTSLKDEVTIRVNIIDIADSLPHFTQQQVFMSVDENATQGEHVGTVVALDKDTSDNEPTSYTITGGNEASVFSLNPTTGWITVEGSLDRETTEQYTLTVMASQRTNLTDPTFDDQQVIIAVNDVNDNSPVFSQQVYVKGIAVDTQTDTEVIQVAATDPDTVDQNALRYSIQRIQLRDLDIDGFSPDPMSTFAINSSTGLITRTIKFPETASGYADLDVIVFDSSQNHNATCQVTVYLLRETQRLLITINRPVSDVARDNNGNWSFITKLNDIIGDVEVTVDEIAVHVNSDGSLDESKTDLYIHAIRDNTSQIVEASELIERMEQSQDKVSRLKTDFDVDQIRTLTSEDDDVSAGVVLATVFGSVGILILITLFLILLFFLRKQRKELEKVNKKSEEIMAGGGGGDKLSSMEVFMRKNQFHSPVPGTRDFLTRKLYDGNADMFSNRGGGRGEGEVGEGEDDDEVDSAFGPEPNDGSEIGSTVADRDFWSGNNMQMFLEEAMTGDNVNFSESQLVALEIAFDDRAEEEEQKPSPIGHIPVITQANDVNNDNMQSF
ncbi:cadherin-23-like [Convolutriloba macropyga]|uniref:cadherin-23-like n=1 Tax=Convolutriloba macropyga TaxID=536237 RepID=UPI003F520211